jgi:transposase
MATRKYFTKEFKLEAVRLLEQSGKSGTELGRQLGVRRNQLYKWQTELRGKAERAFPGRGQHPEMADELTRLKRELESVKEERDILKKAVAFFAKESS